jgi:hypothetical protein
VGNVDFKKSVEVARKALQAKPENLMPILLRYDEEETQKVQQSLYTDLTPEVIEQALFELVSKTPFRCRFVYKALLPEKPPKISWCCRLRWLTLDGKERTAFLVSGSSMALGKGILCEANLEIEGYNPQSQSFLAERRSRQTDARNLPSRP